MAGIYVLEFVTTHKDTGAIRADQFPKFFVCDWEHISEVAQKEREHAEAVHAELNIRVKPVLLNELCQKSFEFITRLVAERDMTALVSEVLASEVAQHRAKAGLLINPDLNQIKKQAMKEAVETANEIRKANTDAMLGRQIASA